MGDFAAGKMGVAPVTPVSLDQFEQFIVDVEDKFAALGCDAEMGGPASEAETAHLPNDDNAPLAALLMWHNGALPIDVYMIKSAAEIPPVEDPELVLPIGADLDGGELFVQPSTGVIFKADPGEAPTSAEMTLASFLGLFRDNLAGNKLEWADGWIEKA